MKLLIYPILVVGLLVCGPLASAQSAGGGGGPDRPMRINEQRPAQATPIQQTCFELQTMLNYFGRLRVNLMGYSGMPIFKLVSTHAAIRCGGNEEIRSFYVQTADRDSCQLGYICVQRQFSH